MFFITGSRQENEDREAEGPQSGEGIGELCPDTELALKKQREKMKYKTDNLAWENLFETGFSKVILAG